MYCAALYLNIRKAPLTVFANRGTLELTEILDLSFSWNLWNLWDSWSISSAEICRTFWVALTSLFGWNFWNPSRFVTSNADTKLEMLDSEHITLEIGQSRSTSRNFTESPTLGPFSRMLSVDVSALRLPYFLSSHNLRQLLDMLIC